MRENISASGKRGIRHMQRFALIGLVIIGAVFASDHHQTEKRIAEREAAKDRQANFQSFENCTKYSPADKCEALFLPK
jgi:hypothetical protein